jgi:hypothetical protein
MKQKRPNPEPVTATTGEEVKRLFTYGFGAIYGKGLDDLGLDDRHRLEALRRYFAYRHNGFLLAEALELCVGQHCNPPAWVLEAFAEGFGRFQRGRVSLDRALHMTMRDEQEYRQYRAEGDMMRAVRKAIAEDPRRRIAPACLAVAAEKGLNPETVEKQYRRFWRGFFDYLGTE